MVSYVEDLVGAEEEEIGIGHNRPPSLLDEKIERANKLGEQKVDPAVIDMADWGIDIAAIGTQLLICGGCRPGEPASGDFMRRLGGDGKDDEKRIVSLLTRDTISRHRQVVGIWVMPPLIVATIKFVRAGCPEVEKKDKEHKITKTFTPTPLTAEEEIYNEIIKRGGLQLCQGKWKQYESAVEHATKEKLIREERNRKKDMEEMAAWKLQKRADAAGMSVPELLAAETAEKEKAKVALQVSQMRGYAQRGVKQAPPVTTLEQLPQLVPSITAEPSTAEHPVGNSENGDATGEANGTTHQSDDAVAHDDEDRWVLIKFVKGGFWFEQDGEIYLFGSDDADKVRACVITK